MYALVSSMLNLFRFWTVKVYQDIILFNKLYFWDAYEIKKTEKPKVVRVSKRLRTTKLSFT